VDGVLTNVICIGTFDAWHTVIYRTAGNDFLTYESQARSILESGSLRGGESVFYAQPAMRYILFFTRVIFGDSDTLLSVVAFSALQIAAIAAVALVAVRIVGRPLARWVCFGLGLILLGIDTGSVIEQAVQDPMSEGPVWICIPAGVALLLFACDRRWLLSGTILLAICAVSRTELVPAVSVILGAGVVCWWARDRAWVAICVAIYLGVLALPLAHNLIYGERPVLFTTTGPVNVRLSLSQWSRVFSNARIRARAEHQVRALFYDVPEASSDSLHLLFRVIQVCWLVAFLSMLVYWRRTSWTTKALLVVPLVALAPFLVFDVMNYYPRHIVAGQILMVVAVIVGLALEPSWLATPAKLRSLGDRQIAGSGPMRG
jgi:hypothetical protein